MGFWLVPTNMLRNRLSRYSIIMLPLFKMYLMIMRRRRAKRFKNTCQYTTSSKNVPVSLKTWTIFRTELWDWVGVTLKVLSENAHKPIQEKRVLQSIAAKKCEEVASYLQNVWHSTIHEWVSLQAPKLNRNKYSASLNIWGNSC